MPSRTRLFVAFLSLVLLISYGLALARSPAPPGGGGGGAYDSAVRNNSRSQIDLQGWRRVPNPIGRFANVTAVAITSSGSAKSRYMSHNTRLFRNGAFVDRSNDVTVEVWGATDTNYITSISTARVSREYSCGLMIGNRFEARGWHKAISLDRENVILNTSDSRRG